MAVNYPDTEGFAYSFARAELTCNKKIYTAISNVSIDQPTEEAAVKGMSPYPLARTEGTMDLGDGTLTFSDDRERIALINDLASQGVGYRNALWGLSYVMRNVKTGEEVQIKCISCRIKGNPIDHAEGADALGGDLAFSFLEYTVNGHRAHS